MIGGAGGQVVENGIRGITFSFGGIEGARGHSDRRQHDDGFMKESSDFSPDIAELAERSNGLERNSLDVGRGAWAVAFTAG